MPSALSVGIVCLGFMAGFACAADQALEECGCKCSGDGSWCNPIAPTNCQASYYRVLDSGCSSTSKIGCALFTNWQNCAGTPYRSWSPPPTEAPWPVGVNVGPRGMLRFGVSDTSLSLSVFSASVDPCPGMSGVAVGGSIGLAESGQGATGQAATPPCAFVDFLVPVAAVWIQLDEAPGGVNCGARFQRFDPSTSTFVTVASLTPSATDGGVLVDIAQLEAAHGGAASADLRSYGIRRVIFDPPEAGDARRTRICRLSWRTMDSALEAGAVIRPLLAEVIGQLDASVGPVNRGARAVNAAWPTTDFRMRSNSRSHIAGIGSAGAALDDSEWTRAVLWYRAGSAASAPDPMNPEWQRLDLEPSINGVSVDSVACAISEPFSDQAGVRWVAVGGAYATPCTPGVASSSCDKPHARVWLVRLGAFDVPTGEVVPVPISDPYAGQSGGDDLGESVIEDLRLASDSNGAFLIGCGRAAVRCGTQNLDGDVRWEPISDPAAATFVIPVGVIDGAVAGYCRVIDRVAVPVGDCGPPGATAPPPAGTTQSVQVSRGHGWIRNDPPSAGEASLAAIGDSAWINQSCPGSTGGLRIWCSWQHSAHRWDLVQRPSACGATDQSWLGFVRWRFAPAANGLDNPGNVARGFAAFAGIRSQLPSGQHFVQTAGWLVDGCHDASVGNDGGCACDPQAAIIEYEESSACWTPTAGSEQTSGQSTSGCVRALNLHLAIQSRGPGPGIINRRLSKASSLCVQRSSAAAQSLVSGARFVREADATAARAVVWTGRHVTGISDGGLPTAQWCGREIGELVNSVRARSSEGQWSKAPWISLDMSGVGAVVFAAHEVQANGSMLATGSLQVGSPCVALRIMQASDLDQDGNVGPLDLAMLLGGWTNPGAADLTGDGLVNGIDLAVLLSDWGPNFTHWECSGSEQSSREIDVVLLASHLLGFESVAEVGDAMRAMTSQQALSLAEEIVDVAELLR